MKVIILISSIFYILGLKIGQKINFIKQLNPVNKIINLKEQIRPNEKSITWKEARENEAKKDTVNVKKSVQKKIADEQPSSK
ncbi:MAG: hypothetical protein CR996_01720 [Draconibacterium sp.]|nr:MAG: hypothetical protein CR996_01720 [Draconibacterium sp.]PIF06508.1 MAG: hypothetical protein CSA36_01300 [Draconibacterium sp.]